MLNAPWATNTCESCGKELAEGYTKCLECVKVEKSGTPRITYTEQLGEAVLDAARKAWATNDKALFVEAMQGLAEVIRHAATTTPVICELELALENARKAYQTKKWAA